MNPPQSANAEQQFEELLDQYWQCAFDEGREGRTHDTEDGKAQRTLSALRALFKPQATYRVFINCMQESHRITYWAQLESTQRPANADIFDSTGRISPFYSEVLEEALEEAQSWAEFLGVEVEPFVKPAWHDSAVETLKARAIALTQAALEHGKQGNQA